MGRRGEDKAQILYCPCKRVLQIFSSGNQREVNIFSVFKIKKKNLIPFLKTEHFISKIKTENQLK